MEPCDYSGSLHLEKNMQYEPKQPRKDTKNNRRDNEGGNNSEGNFGLVVISTIGKVEEGTANIASQLLDKQLFKVSFRLDR